MHVSLIKQLLAMHVYLFILLQKTTKCSQIRAVCHPLQLEVSTHENHFQLITEISRGLFIGVNLDFAFCTQDGL